MHWLTTMHFVTAVSFLGASSERFDTPPTKTSVQPTLNFFEHYVVVVVVEGMSTWDVAEQGTKHEGDHVDAAIVIVTLNWSYVCVH